MSESGTIRAGIGGWIFEPWRGTFYPKGLSKTKELEYAGQHLQTIEINSTYYGTQKPATFAKWASQVPNGFIFSVKGNRFVTNRRVLAEAGNQSALHQVRHCRAGRPARATNLAVCANKEIRCG